MDDIDRRKLAERAIDVCASILDTYRTLAPDSPSLLEAIAYLLERRHDLVGQVLAPPESMARGEVSECTPAPDARNVIVGTPAVRGLRVGENVDDADLPKLAERAIQVCANFLQRYSGVIKNGTMQNGVTLLKARRDELAQEILARLRECDVDPATNGQSLLGRLAD